MITHTHIEKTLVIIKPDGVSRGLVGDIISRFEKTGLKLLQMKLLQATEELVEKHYTLDPDWKRSVGQKTIDDYVQKGLPLVSDDPIVIADMILKRLATYMTSGPIVVAVLEGAHAVKNVRKIVGSTEPFSATMGTIRGDYSLDSYQIAMDEDRSIRNLVHASGSVKEAEEEIGLWFSQ